MLARLLCRRQLFAMLWTVACQAPLSTGLSQQEYWSGLPVPTPGHLLDPGIEPASPAALALQADSLLLSHLGSLLGLYSLKYIYIFFFLKNYEKHIKVNSIIPVFLVWIETIIYFLEKLYPTLQSTGQEAKEMDIYSLKE